MILCRFEACSAGLVKQENFRNPLSLFLHHPSPPGSRPSLAQEVTPTNSHQRLLRPAASPLAAAHRLHSPSPAILNFTLQNLGLIAPSGPPPAQPQPAGAFVAPQTPGGVSPLTQRNMVFIKPVSPLGTPPLTLINLQQVREMQPQSELVPRVVEGHQL